MKHIVLTGGGTAGHVTPNIALIPTLKAAGYQISYIGSYEGIERKLIEEMGIPYYGISSGKLRRYFDPKNFSDPFRVLKGFHEAKKLLKKLKPDVVFSKGGFVTVPVVIAAKKCKIPAIIHESDMTPGLANYLVIPSAVKVCCNFPETTSQRGQRSRQRILRIHFRQTGPYGNRRKPRCSLGQRPCPQDPSGTSKRIPGHPSLRQRQNG